jgi:hypothetical protein
LEPRLNGGQTNIRTAPATDENLVTFAGLLEVVPEVVATFVGPDVQSVGRFGVELRGFEPLTYALPARRSVQLSYSPVKLELRRKINGSSLSVLGGVRRSQIPLRPTASSCGRR